MEDDIRCRYAKRATKKQLIECIFHKHVPEDHHYHYCGGDFLKNSWPRRCTHCGCLLKPDKWEPVETTKSK